MKTGPKKKIIKKTASVNGSSKVATAGSSAQLSQIADFYCASAKPSASTIDKRIMLKG